MRYSPAGSEDASLNAKGFTTWPARCLDRRHGSEVSLGASHPSLNSLMRSTMGNQGRCAKYLALSSVRRRHFFPYAKSPSSSKFHRMIGIQAHMIAKLFLLVTAVKKCFLRAWLVKPMPRKEAGDKAKPRRKLYPWGGEILSKAVHVQCPVIKRSNPSTLQ